MYKEMTCKFNHEIDEALRQELANGKLTGTNAQAASWCNMRGMAMVELGYLDIELNVNTLDREVDDLEETVPICDYFICVKHGDDAFDWDWESFGYADDYISVDGVAHVDWAAEDWEEQLFRDMLKSLVKFAQVVNDQHAVPAGDLLSFLRPNALTVSIFG